MNIAPLLLWGIIALAGSPEPQADENVCVVRYWGEARYRPPGYDHIVHIASACSVDLTCKVTTNVNRDGVSATVPPRSHIEVTTWVASPAREFSVQVSCTK